MERDRQYWVDREFPRDNGNADMEAEDGWNDRKEGNPHGEHHNPRAIAQTKITGSSRRVRIGILNQADDASELRVPERTEYVAGPSDEGTMSYRALRDDGNIDPVLDSLPTRPIRPAINSDPDDPFSEERFLVAQKKGRASIKRPTKVEIQLS